MSALLPLTHWQRCKKFGRFRFRPDPTDHNPEHITILDGWAVSEITYVRCEQLVQFGRAQVSINYRAKDAFLGLWQAWEDEGLLDIIESWNGSYAPRYKRGRAPGLQPGVPIPILYASPALSNHSWGTAFDINAKLCPMGRPAPSSSGMRQLEPIANEFGWFWGGRFKGRPDPMHYEYVGR